jgi:hypothetical protein
MLRAILLSRLRLVRGNPEGNAVISSTGAAFILKTSIVKTSAIKISTAQFKFIEREV